MQSGLDPTSPCGQTWKHRGVSAAPGSGWGDNVQQTVWLHPTPLCCQRGTPGGQHFIFTNVVLGTAGTWRFFIEIMHHHVPLVNAQSYFLFWPPCVLVFLGVLSISLESLHTKLVENPKKFCPNLPLCDLLTNKNWFPGPKKSDATDIFGQKFKFFIKRY